MIENSKVMIRIEYERDETRKAFYGQRKISIIDYFLTCGEIVKDFAEFEEFNNNVAEMILGITTNR